MRSEAQYLKKQKDAFDGLMALATTLAKRFQDKENLDRVGVVSTKRARLPEGL